MIYSGLICAYASHADGSTRAEFVLAFCFVVASLTGSYSFQTLSNANNLKITKIMLSLYKSRVFYCFSMLHAALTYSESAIVVLVSKTK